MFDELTFSAKNPVLYLTSFQQYLPLGDIAEMTTWGNRLTEVLSLNSCNCGLQFVLIQPNDEVMHASWYAAANINGLHDNNITGEYMRNKRPIRSRSITGAPVNHFELVVAR